MRRHLLIAALLILAAHALADPTPARAAWVWPVDGDVITPYRNGTDPYASGQHRGIDIGARAGTAVVAAAGGEVRFAGTAGSSGLTISVRTSDGYDTSYLHLSSLAVSAGGRVSAGERIGAVGTTGTRSAAAPHLHFGVREAGTRHDYRDPLAFLPTPPATRAPEPPPATPGPVPEPAVRAPVLEPAPPAALPVPAPRHQPAPRRAPRPQPALRGAPAPRRAPHPAPARRAPQRVGAPRAAPRSIPSPLGSQLPDRHERAPAGAPVTLRSAPAAEASTSAVDAEPAHGGPDIGWVLACAGLLLAAGILTLTNDGRPASPDRRERLARMLPLFIRR